LKSSSNVVQVSGRKERFLLIGTVVRPHGIRGELKVRPYTQRIENICQYPRLYLADEDGQNKFECTGVSARVNGNTVILKLNECPDRDRAEQLVGQHVWLSANDLPPTGVGEFYLHTLLDKRVKTTAGQDLGMVKGVLNSGQDLLVIWDGEHEYIVPAVGPFIASIGEADVVLDLPPGLLEINRSGS
jgi:16S rRNA processing protein RimM